MLSSMQSDIIPNPPIQISDNVYIDIFLTNLNEHQKNLEEQHSKDILNSLEQFKHLPKFEKIVIYEAFSIENGFLTPTQKVKFSEVIKHYNK